MAKIFSMADLLGGHRPGRNASRGKQPTGRLDEGKATKKSQSMDKNMSNFSHLSTMGNDDPPYQNERKQTQANGKTGSVGSYRVSKQHSREHNVAVSEEAKQSPVLAVQLLRTTELNSTKIRKRLSDDPEALSKYTANFMEENEPGWEFLNDEEKASSASQYALHKADRNGYLISRDRAINTLKAMEEPLTEDEKASMIEGLRQERNATDPNTPDNVAAREQADDEYYEQMAKAMIARNNQIRATGVVLPGDSRTAEGKPVAPRNELQLIKTRLKAGVPPELPQSGMTKP